MNCDVRLQLIVSFKDHFQNKVELLLFFFISIFQMQFDIQTF